VNDKQ